MAASNGGNLRQLPLQTHTRTDEVIEETPDIVTFFIADRARAQGHVVPEEMNSITVEGEIATCLRQVSKEKHSSKMKSIVVRRIMVSTSRLFLGQ